MPGGSVGGTVTRIAAFKIHSREERELQEPIINARGGNSFGKEILPLVFNVLADDESVSVLIELDNGLELTITRSGEVVNVCIWPMQEKTLGLPPDDSTHAPLEKGAPDARQSLVCRAAHSQR